MEELSYLKIHPRDQEENKLLLLKGERVYEESLGQDRIMVEHAIHRFEMILNTHDNGKIEEARKEFAQFLEEFQE